MGGKKKRKKNIFFVLLFAKMVCQGVARQFIIKKL
jgi:hypothetical protein